MLTSITVGGCGAYLHPWRRKHRSCEQRRVRSCTRTLHACSGNGIDKPHTTKRPRKAGNMPRDAGERSSPLHSPMQRGAQRGKLTGGRRRRAQPRRARRPARRRQSRRSQGWAFPHPPPAGGRKQVDIADQAKHRLLTLAALERATNQLHPVKRTADTMMASKRVSSCIAFSSGRSRVSKLDTTASFTSAQQRQAIRERRQHPEHILYWVPYSGQAVSHSCIVCCKQLLTCVSKTGERCHCPGRHGPGLLLRKIGVNVL